VATPVAASLADDFDAVLVLREAVDERENPSSAGAAIIGR